MDRFARRAHIAAAPATVFGALTDPAALTVWLDGYADVSLTEGRYSLEGERGRKRLRGFEADSRLRFAWQIGGVEMENDITLEPEGAAGVLHTLTTTNIPRRDGAEPSVLDFWAIALNNPADYAEERNPGGHIDLSAPVTHEGRARFTIAASLEQVWTALAEPAQLNRWMAIDARVELQPGGRFDPGWDHGPVNILEREPGRLLAYSWEWPAETNTTVHRRLEGSEGRTRVTTTHSGFAGPKNAAGYRLGWQAFLATLKRMLEGGDTCRAREIVVEAPAA